MKINPKYIYPAIIILLLCLIAYMSTCDRKTIVVDNLTTEQKSLIKEFNKVDTNLTVRNTRIVREKDTIIKYEIRYKTKVIEVIKVAPDTCNPYLIDMVNEAGYLDSIKSYHILRQDSSITDYKKQVHILKKITANDTIRITQLSDSLRTERKSKKKYIRGFKHGIATGVLISGVVYLRLL